MTTFDFGKGPVPAHQHPNGGGWVADTAHVDESAIVEPDARVYDHARIGNIARIRGNAKVFGNAHIFGQAIVAENAQVYGNARATDAAIICDNAQVYGDAFLLGEAWISGNARIFGNAEVGHYTRVGEDVTVFGKAYLSGRSIFCGKAEISGDFFFEFFTLKNFEGNVAVHGKPVQIPVVDDLDRKIAEAVGPKGEHLTAKDWHEGSSHSHHGWAIHLAGDDGYALEEAVGSWLAGSLIYVKSTGREIPNYFEIHGTSLRIIKNLATMNEGNPS